jgi:pyridoxamine 5'-phosphate oxidase-like protein
MGKQFASMTPAHRDFIARRHIFFAASATATSRVNVSPRPTDALRVLDERTVAFLDLTGSGSETAAHLRADGRITLMFCALDEPPNIMRLYGRGTSLPRGSGDYAALLASAYGNQEPLGARQIVRIDVDLVQTSCGYGVPLFEYVGERDTLRRWAEQKGDAGLEEYRRQKNAHSIDGLPTGLAEEDSAPVAMTSTTRS